MTIRTIGRDEDSDLVIERASLARRHARAELSAGGWLLVHEQDGPVFLQRNEHWVRVRRASLCAGDRVRLGPHEVPLAELSALFGADAGARLRARPGPPPDKPPAAERPAAPAGDESAPRRNPDTGTIED